MAATVHSVAKAAALLEVFSHRRQVLSVRELATLTGIPRSTCHALCRTLVEAGLLEQHDTEGYQLGPMLAKLGGQVIDRVGLVDAAIGPATSRLASTRSEIHVAQYVPTGIVYLLRLENGRRLPNKIRTGHHWPLHSSACGMAVYAALPPAARGTYDRDLPAPTMALLDDAVRTFVRRGYVISNISQEGFRSVGAPILDERGDVVGAIGTGDVTQLMSPRRTHEVGLAVREAAMDTSYALGFLPSLHGNQQTGPTPS